MGKKKPDASVIRAALPLSARFTFSGGPISACNVCGKESADLRAWREHDERDLPQDGPEHLVFIGRDHDACMKAMKDHPRLYSEEMGNAGYFPALCGPCKRRDGFRCTHPKLRVNGGPGLLVQLRPLYPPNAIICPPPPGPKARAESCEGREA